MGINCKIHHTEYTKMRWIFASSLTMKKLFSALLGMILALLTTSGVYAWWWWKYGSDPMRVLDSVASEANDEYKIQDTQLDDVSPLQWSYPSQYRLTNTLDALRKNIGPYLDRAFFIGLAIAVIMIIYNGFLLVTNTIHGEWERWETKKRLINVVIGVIVLTGVYAILKIVLSLIGLIFTS